MQGAQINSQDSLNDLFKGIERLDTASFEQVVKFITLLKTKRRVKHLSKKETELLLKINTLIAPETQARIDTLNDKADNLTISESERVELIQLLYKIEELDAKRLLYLTELSKIRNVSVLELMKQLKLLPKVERNV